MLLFHSNYSLPHLDTVPGLDNAVVVHRLLAGEGPSMAAKVPLLVPS